MMSWSYTRCADCPGVRRQVMPDGQPWHYRFFLLGEGPGAHEDREGVPFIGPSGQELDQTYLRLAGIDRSEVFVTNAVQCRQDRAGQDVPPAASLLACCSDNHLIEELAAVEPDVVILCGASACRAIERYTGGRIDLELEHGFPRRAELLGRDVWLVPMLHPARGMHESRDMILLLQDWERFGLWLRGKWTPPQPAVVPVHYQLADEWDVSHFANQAHNQGVRTAAVDTEGDEGKLWSVQVSTTAGFAFMVLRENEKAIKLLARWLRSMNEIWLHNAPYDLDELEQIGVRPCAVRDTQQELYHLAGILPQGLKAAVYRVFGHRMTSYDETVTPHSKRALNVWLAEAMAYVTGERLTIPHPIGKGCPTCGKNHRTDQTISKPHEAESVLKRVMGKMDAAADAEDDDGRKYNPWEQPKWQKGEMKTRLLGRSWLDEVERKVGRMPRQSIIHAPLDEAVRYGCSDADWTGRLARWLEGERKRIVEAEWRIAS